MFRVKSLTYIKNVIPILLLSKSKLEVKKMRFTKITFQTVTFLLMLLTLLSFLMIPFSIDSISVTSSNKLDNYGNLLQYEWPQIHGDSGFTRYSEGQAPESADILWKTTIEGIESYVAAFNGKIFVTTATDVIALDKDTGAIIWNTTLPDRQRWPAVFKIDDIHLIISNYCLETETGNILWTSEEFSAKVSNWAESVYSTEEKMFYTQGDSTVLAWNFTDVFSPPKLEWEVYISGATGSGTGIQYGNGRIFPGTFEPHQMALNASTGEVLWDVETTGAMCFSGSYYEGKLLKAGEQDNTFYCFDAETGNILWKYNPGTQLGYWVSGSAVAYDIVYEINKDGHLYALDVNNGNLIWKFQGADYIYWPGWPVVGDGKVYATVDQRVSIHPYTLEYGESRFVCLDAYTGNLIWELPIEAYAPRESTAIAYGNLYIIPGYIEEFKMNSYVTENEVWAIGRQSWALWRGDSENTGTGKSGPTNLNLKWKFNAGGGIVSTPCIVDGRVYFGSQNKNMYCIDAKNGDFLWSYAIGSRIKSSPAVVNGKVYVGPDDGYVYCLDAFDGSFIWKTYAGGFIGAHFDAVTGIRSSPIVVNNKVYVGSLDTKMYCLDAENGFVIWSYKTNGPITSSPAFSDSAIYVTSQEPSSGALYKLDATDGNMIWKMNITYIYSADRGIDLHVSPTVADGMVFIASNKDKYHGINATTGEIVWTFVTARGTEDAGGYLVGSTSYHDGKLFVIDMFFITAINASNGAVIWKSWQGTELYASPTYADGKVYVATDRRLFYVLNASDGKRLSFFEPASNSWSSPALYEGRMYIGNNDWNLYCFNDYPITQGTISLVLDKNEIQQGESITGCGQISPAIAYVPIDVSLIKPDGTLTSHEVIANSDGTFCINYTLDTVGQWTISISCSGVSYSLQRVDFPVVVVEKQENVTPDQTKPETEEPSNGQGSTIPADYLIVLFVLILVAIGAVFAYIILKRKKSGSPVLISD